MRDVVDLVPIKCENNPGVLAGLGVVKKKKYGG